MKGMKRMGWIALLLGCSGVVVAQEQSGWSDEDSAMVAGIHAQILGHGGCYEDLRVLCKDVGARLSGSEEADAAILWGCLLYTSPSPRDQRGSRMPSSA